MKTVQFSDNMNTAIYSVVMTFEGRALNDIRMSDVVAACKEVEETVGFSYQDILKQFVAHVSK